MIEINSLYKSYNKGWEKIFNNLNLVINQGDCIFIQGVSGVGKSTLLNLIALLDTPDSGEILYHGENIYEMSKAKQNEYKNNEIGIIFQKYNLLNSFSVLENILFPVLYREFKLRGDYEKEAKKILIDLGLEEKMHAKISDLSGGQQQRVAIARVLLQNPSIILADEPTANVDTITENEILEIFAKCKLNGTTLIIVSHNSIYDKLANRKIVIKK